MGIDAVEWWGTWEHAACGASGEDQFADDTAPDADHECGLEGHVVWPAEWRCDDCGSSGDDLFADVYSARSGHDCDDEDDPAGESGDDELEAAL
jgi:hypothetical protein